MADREKPDQGDEARRALAIEETALAPGGHDTVKEERHRRIEVGGLDETVATPSGGAVETPSGPLGGAGPVDAGGAPTSGRAAPSRSGRGLRAGDHLGRYVVLEMIGAGGMGEVYAAYDPQLDRRIALKVIRPSTSDDHETVTSARGRLLREAQAMAQLSHPNVISVFDVGTVDDDIYVAMEYVAGRDLRSWLTVEPRSWDQVLPLFVDAARGLAAAHEAGMVHRDFKPDNVLIGDAGRVRVIDFGLARQVDTAPVGGGRAARSRNPHRDLATSASTTRTGAVMGTPAYMAPEQFEGAATDARTDQFNFFVSLYEALLGERPFEGDTFTELAFNVTEGRMRPLPRDHQVPEFLLAAIRRGLSVDPGQRFASMAEAIDAISPRERRRNRWPWLAAGVAVVAGGAVAAVLLISAARTPPCQGLDQPLAGIWDGPRKAEIHAAFTATGLDYAEEVWKRVENTLDAYTAEWVAGRIEACRATAVRKEQSQELLERRMACLDRRLSELDAVVTVISRVDADVLDNATQAVTSLTPLASCANRTLLSTESGSTDDTIDRQLARVRALDAAGKYADGLALARDTLDRSRATAGHPGEPAALYWIGRLESATGDAATGIEHLFEAIRVADAAGDRLAEAEAWLSVVIVTTGTLGRSAEGARWAEHARLAIEQAGNDVELQARLHHALGTIALNQKRYQQALEEYRTATALRERAFGAGDWRVALSRGMAASTLRRMHKNDEAAKEHLAALAALEAALGPNHPRVASLLNNVAISLSRVERYEEARELYQRSLAIRTAVFGPEHESLARPLVNLGGLETKLGHFDAAERDYRQSLAIRERVYGADHPAIPRTLYNLARLRMLQGRLAEAVDLMRDVLTRTETIEGAEHERTGNIRAAMCNVLTRAGRLDAAAKECEHAVRTLVDAPDQNNYAWALTYAGKLDVLRGHPEVGLARLEEAWRIRQASPSEPEYHAETQFALAMAMYAAGKDQPRALELARAAHQTLAGRPSGEQEWLAEIEAWLARNDKSSAGAKVEEPEPR